MISDEFFEWQKAQSPVDTTKPYGWIQYKGTSLCMDVHCSCGHLGHIDSEFCYSIKCANCGKIYSLDMNIKLIELDEEKQKADIYHEVKLAEL